ncbi:O-antigen ligase [Paraglaciecola sp. MB-3u-78]|jgi:O-antigen ligase|uniref:O-antigen ligase family protein n=1 Tax=Paraglaciecola sp. MB-3u-78 TaxID=2058332 RepID=UPI000C324280|nr:O-antigen ligase family protein [Paraglaciecola sp. MB-3u-78]PKG93002.1 polymerase [Paraglaciecola sp. MB-3u-78]
MGTVLLYLLLIATVVRSFKYQETAVYAYFLMSIMAPQFIWFWIFEGIPAFTVAAGTVIVVFMWQAFNKKLDFSIYRYKQNLFLVMFWIMFNLSDYFSPIGEFRTATSSELVLYVFNIIILMYFISLPLITTERALRVLALLFAGLILYYVYWSNTQYFEWNMRQFLNGRLMGPWQSPYRDENKFAMLFVTGMPFLLFGIFYFKSLIMRGLFGLGLLFLWHSIILTGSRGALLAVAVATLASYLVIKSRIFGVLLVCGLIAAVIYQGGQLLIRTTDTMAAAESQPEEKLDPRLQSWDTGLGLIAKFPLLGVGVQRFQEATRIFYPGRPAYVAHNTFLNFAANSGLLNGIIYLSFYWLQFKRFRRIRKSETDPSSTMSYINNSTMVALTGFYAGSMFLDLVIYEPFYFLLMLGLLTEHIYNKQKSINVEVVKQHG